MCVSFPLQPPIAMHTTLDGRLLSLLLTGVWAITMVALSVLMGVLEPMGKRAVCTTWELAGLGIRAYTGTQAAPTLNGFFRLLSVMCVPSLSRSRDFFPSKVARDAPFVPSQLSVTSTR